MKVVAETKSKLPIIEHETGEHRAKFFKDLKGLKQNWTEEKNPYRVRVPGRITQSTRPRQAHPRSYNSGRNSGQTSNRSSQPSILQELIKLTKMLQDKNYK